MSGSSPRSYHTSSLPPKHFAAIHISIHSGRICVFGLTSNHPPPQLTELYASRTQPAPALAAVATGGGGGHPAPCPEFEGRPEAIFSFGSVFGSEFRFESEGHDRIIVLLSGPLLYTHQGKSFRCSRTPSTPNYVRKARGSGLLISLRHLVRKVYHAFSLV